MMKKKNGYIAVITMLLLSGCNKQEVSTDNYLPRLTIKMPSENTGDNFIPGDKLGLYMVAYTDETTPGELKSTGNDADNVAFTLDANNIWQPATPLIRKADDKKADFYGYYPFSAIDDVTRCLFSIQANQQEAQAAHASDLLRAKTEGIASGSTTVPLAFNHILSQFVIKVVAGEGFTAVPDGLSIKILNVKNSVILDLRNGNLQTAETVSDVIPLGITGQAYKAIIPPQTIEGGAYAVEISYPEGGLRYYTPVSPLVFESGKGIELTATISKTGVSFSVGSIGGWNSLPATSGDAEKGTYNKLFFYIPSDITDLILKKAKFTIISPSDTIILDNVEIYGEPRNQYASIMAPDEYTRLTTATFTTTDGKKFDYEFPGVTLNGEPQRIPLVKPEFGTLWMGGMVYIAPDSKAGAAAYTGGKIISLTEGKKAWGPADARSVPTNTTDGAENTSAAIREYPGADYAAHWCRNRNNSFDDNWYLPASDELSELYSVYNGGFSGNNPPAKESFNSYLLKNGGVALGENIYYSSTETPVEYTVYIVDFRNGGKALGAKENTYYVRSIRKY